MSNEIIGMILSLIGMAISILSFQIRKRNSFLLAQTVSVVFFLTALIFSGGGVGAGLNVVNIGRNIWAMRIKDDNKQGRITMCRVCCGAYVLVYAAFWLLFRPPVSDMLWGLLPLTASIFGSLALVQLDPVKLRKIKSVDAACWLTYNCHIGLGALGGILCDSISLISIGLAIWRFRKQDRAAENAERPAGDPEEF